MLDDREQLELRPADERPQVQEQPGSAAPANPDQGDQAKPARSSKLLIVGAVVGVLALGAGAYFGHSWWTTGRFMVMTDDAYVGARSSTLSPKVSGYIADVAVDDNAQVKAGDV